MRSDTGELSGEVPGVLETAAILREVTAGLITSDDFDGALARLARIIRDAVSEVTWCGVTVLRSGAPASVAASEPRLRALDDVRYGTDGPAMTAIRQRELVWSADLRAETRWPCWTAQAVALGVHGVLAVPVDVDEHVIGSINLYARDPGGLGAAQQLTAMLLAEHAGLLLGAVRDRARQVELAGDLARRPSAGRLIDQAIGVIMTQRGCSATEALQVLRSASAALALPLRDVAERLVTSVARPRDT
ncbi:GAF and ANTAR domain-containing protein [Micromonospora sp. HM5-17]|uniref:GAF and ANTAR domain-containing protein n=1 Tax=Micromonospora sp. HM5-17 TaxID=2487710 RepID=UPI000F47C816|nr:GAF and ANTAR domain-containing protein [Micromonospora sp. HM5-17]ROT29866.1 ANTAR domain-containing protein [Micromonospora sp. HM5-17]